MAYDSRVWDWESVRAEFPEDEEKTHEDEMRELV